MLTTFLFWAACWFGGLFIAGAIADSTGPAPFEPDPDSLEALLGLPRPRDGRHAAYVTGHSTESA